MNDNTPLKLLEEEILLESAEARRAFAERGRARHERLNEHCNLEHFVSMLDDVNNVFGMTIYAADKFEAPEDAVTINDRAAMESDVMAFPSGLIVDDDMVSDVFKFTPYRMEMAISILAQIEQDWLSIPKLVRGTDFVSVVIDSIVLKASDVFVSTTSFLPQRKAVLTVRYRFVVNKEE